MLLLSAGTVSVSRVAFAEGEDLYDTAAPAPTVITPALRAVVGIPALRASSSESGGLASLAGGERAVYETTVLTDPSDIQIGDIVTENLPGAPAWTVLWIRPVAAMGMTYMTGKLRMVEGESP